MAWVPLTKTADSTLWWGKQAFDDTTFYYGDPPVGVPVTAGDWALVPDPLPTTDGTAFASITVVTDAALWAAYTAT